MDFAIPGRGQGTRGLRGMGIIVVALVLIVLWWFLFAGGSPAASPAPGGGAVPSLALPGPS
jgi:hypothetical protein